MSVLDLMDQTSSGSSGPTTTTAGPLADPTGAASVPSKSMNSKYESSLMGLALQVVGPNCS